MRETLNFAVELLLSPPKAVRRLQGPGAALTQSIILYLVFLLASVAFYAWKPENFPLPSGDMPVPVLGAKSHGLLFWTEVQLWEPLLSGIWIVFLAWFATFFCLDFASLPVLIILGGMIGLAPGLLLLLHYAGKLSWPFILIFWVAACVLIFPSLKRRAFWKPLISMILAINIVNLAFLIPAIFSVAARSSTAYTWVAAVGGLWMLALGSFLLARLDNISTARAFSAFFLSFLWQTFFCGSLYFLNLLPKEILKAMLLSF